MIFTGRFPKKEHIVQVYAVAVTLLYSWAVFASLKDFTTNWGLFLGLADILGITAYVLAGALLESLLLLAALLLIAFILPKKLFAEKFVLYGSILAIALTGSLMYLYTQIPTSDIIDHITDWATAFLGGTAVLVIIGETVPFVRKAFELLAERCVAFLYIYLPVSILSILLILARNLF